MKYSVEEIIECLRFCAHGCSDKCKLRWKSECVSILKETAAEMLESHTNKTPYKTLRIYADGRIEDVSE